MKRLPILVCAAVLATNVVLAEQHVRQHGDKKPAPEYHQEFFAPEHEKQRDVVHERLRTVEPDRIVRVIADPEGNEQFFQKIERFAPDHTAQIQQLQAELTEMQEAQELLEEHGLDDAEAREYAMRLQEEIHEVKAHVTDLVTDLTDTVGVSAMADVVYTEEGGNAAYSDEEWELLRELEQELAYRDELITELIESMTASDTSSLAASLLAIEEHPAASGAVAVFAGMLLYIFRTRIAELSGFGIKITMRNEQKKSTQEPRDTASE